MQKILLSLMCFALVLGCSKDSEELFKYELKIHASFEYSEFDDIIDDESNYMFDGYILNDKGQKIETFAQECFNLANNNFFVRSVSGYDLQEGNYTAVLIAKKVWSGSIDRNPFWENGKSNEFWGSCDAGSSGSVFAGKITFTINKEAWDGEYENTNQSKYKIISKQIVLNRVSGRIKIETENLPSNLTSISVKMDKFLDCFNLSDFTCNNYNFILGNTSDLGKSFSFKSKGDQYYLEYFDVNNVELNILANDEEYITDLEILYEYEDSFKKKVVEEVVVKRDVLTELNISF